MAPKSKLCRKRTIEDANSDPCKFLSAYFKARGIPESPEEDDALLNDCAQLADSARESFKRWRSSAEVPAFAEKPECPPLTPKEKYQKRLVNNRRSAAAARVYQEVLRREHTHSLRKVVAEKIELKTAVGKLESTLDELKKENERLASLKEVADDGKEPTENGAVIDSRVDARSKENPEKRGTDGSAQDFGDASGKLEPGQVLKAAPTGTNIDAEEGQSNCDTGPSSGSSVSEKADPGEFPVKESPSCTARVTTVSVLPVVGPNVNAEGAVATMTSALIPLLNSQGTDGGLPPEETGNLTANVAVSACFSTSAVGLLSSQLSLPDNTMLMSRCGSGSSSENADEFPDLSQLLNASQEVRGFSSQLFSSQTAQ